LSVTLRSLYALVSHLCLTGLPEVVMPSSDMWQECQITLQHTRPWYAKSSYRLVDPRPFMETSTRSTTYQMDRPTPLQQQQCSHCDSVEASHWSRSLESDATVQADYALTTTTTTAFSPSGDSPRLRFDFFMPPPACVGEGGSMQSSFDVCLFVRPSYSMTLPKLSDNGWEPPSISSCNCNEADETALHYLCYCSHYGAVRTKIWGKPFLHPSEAPHITVIDLLRFLTSSRRFS